MPLKPVFLLLLFCLFVTIFVYSRLLCYQQLATGSVLLEKYLQITRACFVRGLENWKVPENLGLLREALTNGCQAQEYECPFSCLLVTVKHNLKILEFPWGIQLKLPSMRLHLKSSSFLAISLFLSYFFLSLPDLHEKHFLANYKYMLVLIWGSDSREASKITYYVAATILDTWHNLSITDTQPNPARSVLLFSYYRWGNWGPEREMSFWGLLSWEWVEPES